MIRLSKLFAILLALVAVYTPAKAQQNPTQGHGAPSGQCNGPYMDIDTGNLYGCKLGAYVLSSGGGVPSGATGSLQINNGGSFGAATNWTFSGSLLQGANLGTFDNLAQYEFLVSTLNSCSPTSVFQATQANNFGTDALAGCVAVPASPSNGFSSGVAGYATNAATTSACPFGVCSAVGVAGTGLSLAAGNEVWGGNFVTQTTSGHAAKMQGVEIDVNPENATDSGSGLTITNLGTTGSTAGIKTLPAIWLAPTGTGAKGFTTDLLCDTGSVFFNGVTSGGDCVASYEQATGNSQPSNYVSFYEKDSGGTEHAYSIYTAAGTVAVLNFSGPVKWASTQSGTCTMTTTSCTATVWSGAAHCIATVQGTSGIAGACSISGTTLTVTAASSNTATWAWLVTN